MIEIFDPESYLYSNQPLMISKCNFCFKNGIVLNDKLLYFLLKGSYAETYPIKKGNFVYTDDERINYKSLNILLDKIKKEVGEYTIFITPHIFTKFINELRNGVGDPRHFSNILTCFMENFNYIKEKEIKKEEIINTPLFKNRYCGLSETSLILLKDKLGKIGIIDSSENKILEMGRDNYLFVNFPILVSVIRKYEEREQIR